MRAVWLVALCLGCGFTADKNPSNLDSTDLLGADFSGVDFSSSQDLSTPPGADLSPVPDLSAKGLCAGALLLVTVENVDNPPKTGGKVVVMSLGDGSNLPSVCTTLTAQGNLTTQPMSVAMMGSQLAVQGIDSLQLIDAQNDVVLWSKPAGSTDFPVDVFALKHPDGRTLVAAGWASTGTSPPWAIRRVDGWALDGTAVKSWGLNGADLPLGLSILGMCSHPKMPQHLLALDPTNNQWGWDVDPWSASKTALHGNATGAPVSIYADTWSTLERTAWVDSSNSKLYYNNDNVSGVLGPVSCSGCMLLHAVPDPTTNLRFFGLCDGPTIDARRVVRFSSGGGSCDTVLEGAQYGSLSRLSRLGIGQ